MSTHEIRNERTFNPSSRETIQHASAVAHMGFRTITGWKQGARFRGNHIYGVVSPTFTVVTDVLALLPTVLQSCGAVHGSLDVSEGG